MVHLSDTELAAGMVFGFDPTIEELPEAPGGTRGPRAALEEVIGEALLHPPCVVTFSGGRDSSSLLALAAHVARRDGLAMPVPVTLRISGSADAEESGWQELVLRHLGIDDWVKIEVGDELDAVGPVAAGAMTRHGLLWPFNTHFHVPMFRQATGGTIISGSGGDELGLSTETARAERILARRRLRSWSEVAIAGLAVAPRAVRRAVYIRRESAAMTERPWLTAPGRREVARATAGMDAEIPLGWDRVIRRSIWRARYFRMALSCFDTLAADYRARSVHPLFDPRVLAALADAGGFAGVGSRTDLVRMLFGDLLPAATVTRSSKATFDDVLWSVHTRRFADAWSGGGLPAGLVDPEVLRRHWRSERPHATTAMMIQAAWIHDHPGSSGQSGQPVEE